MSEQEIILELQKALEQALIGGNHIASNLIGLLGPGFNEYQSTEEARREISKGLEHPVNWMNEYEQWCCWNALMKAREKARYALESYPGEVLPTLQD